MEPVALRSLRAEPARPHATSARWPLSALLLMALLVGAVVAPSPVAAASCPRPPVDLATLIALQPERGPLAIKYPPVYGAFYERAQACFGRTELTLSAFVAAPEGLGGTTTFYISPAWFEGGFFVQPSAEEISPGFGVGPRHSAPRPRQLPWAMLQIVQYCVLSLRGCSRTVRIANAMSSGRR